MLTIHAAPLVLPAGPAPLQGGAVVVDGDRIAAVGTFADVAAAYPAARVREWPGVLTPGLLQRDVVRLLDESYFPDPREAGELGTRPVSGAARDALAMTGTRRSGSDRRGVQQMLRHGTTAVAVAAAPAPLLTAVRRSGLMIVATVPPRPGAGPRLDPLAHARTLSDAVAAPLAVGSRADLAVFDVRDEAELIERGAGTCVATVAAGRLVYRGR